MKKILGLLLLLLIPTVIYQMLSMQDLARLRNWSTHHPSDTIRVGVDWPLATNRDGFDEGLILAQEELNAQGVLGKRFQLVFRDDHMDLEEGRRIAIDFATDPRMSAVIGYYDDNIAVQASPILERSHLLHLVAGANSTYMTSHGFRYMLRTVLPNSRIAPGLARLCLAQGYRTFAIIAEEGAFGADLAYQFGNELDAHNAHVVYQTTYVRGHTDFRDIVNDIRPTAPDMIFMAGFEYESAVFLSTARGMGLATPVLGSFSDTPEVHAIAGKALEGVMNYDVYDLDTPSPENKAFVAKYRARWHHDPSGYAAQGYDALRLLAKGMVMTGSTDGLDVSYALRCMPAWEGANGTYKFDNAGELGEKPVYMYKYQNGRPLLFQVSVPTPAPAAPAPATAAP